MVEPERRALLLKLRELSKAGFRDRYWKLEIRTPTPSLVLPLRQYPRPEYGWGQPHTLVAFLELLGASMKVKQRTSGWVILNGFHTDLRPHLRATRSLVVMKQEDSVPRRGESLETFKSQQLLLGTRH